MANIHSDGKQAPQNDAPSGDPWAGAQDNRVKYEKPEASAVGQVGTFAENPYGPTKP